MAMPRGRLSDEEPCFSDADQEEEDDDDIEEDEKRIIRQKAYERYLPDLKNWVRETYAGQKPNLVTDKGEKSCAVCPTLQWFKGWKALLAHAETFKKKRVHQHRGYCDAIKEALRVNQRSQSDDDGGRGGARTASIDPEAAKNHLIVWPPLLIVEIMQVKRDLREMALAFLFKEFPKLHEPKFLQLSEYRGLFVFRAEVIGYLEAQMVAKKFPEPRNGRDERAWFERNRRGLVDEHRQSRMIAFLATPDDMKLLDPERRKVDWKEESYYERVPQAQKKVNEENDNERARLKEMEQKVENLTENELKLKERKQHFERLIECKQKEIASQRRRAEDMERSYREKMHSLDAEFQKDIRIFEARSTVRMKRLREQLQENEKRLEEERITRMKEIENLQKQFQVLTEDIKQKQTQKAVARELEVMQKKKNFMADMAKAEALFNQKTREQESNLQDSQHQEMMQLLEEAKEEREKLLQEWLGRQEILKKEGEEAKQAKEQLEEEEACECGLCLDPINEDNRAVFRPCGHARMCIECSIEVFKEKGFCPFCREKISKKPILLPKKMFM